jgi:hypothetical protein
VGIRRRRLHRTDRGNERKWDAIRRMLVVGESTTVSFREVAHEADVTPHSVYQFFHKVMVKFANVDMIDNSRAAHVTLRRWPSLSELSDHNQRKAVTDIDADSVTVTVSDSSPEPVELPLVARLRAYRRIRRMAEVFELQVVADAELDAIIEAATEELP